MIICMYFELRVPCHRGFDFGRSLALLNFFESLLQPLRSGAGGSGCLGCRDGELGAEMRFQDHLWLIIG